MKGWFLTPLIKAFLKTRISNAGHLSLHRAARALYWACSCGLLWRCLVGAAAGSEGGVMGAMAGCGAGNRCGKTYMKRPLSTQVLQKFDMTFGSKIRKVIFWINQTSNTHLYNYILGGKKMRRHFAKPLLNDASMRTPFLSTPMKKLQCCWKTCWKFRFNPQQHRILAAERNRTSRTKIPRNQKRFQGSLH